MTIPHIDISALYDGPSAARDAVDLAVMAAAADAGFMTVSWVPGDALSAELRRRMLSIFSLPEAAKRALWRWSFDRAHPNLYRGWFPLQNGHPTYKEGIDMGPDVAHDVVPDPADPLKEATPLPPEAALPGWRAAVASYYRAMEQTGAVIMRAFARGLGLAEDRFDAAFEGGISTLRLIRYPLRDAASFAGREAELRVGGGYLLGAAHVDSGFVTLLAQDGVEGLQAEARDGTWLTVPPREGTLAVNFGKLLEQWTGGQVRATTHRVVGWGHERFSIPFFFEPAVDAVIAPLEGLDGEPFTPVAYGDFLWSLTTRFVEQRGIAHLRQPKGLPVGP